MKKVHNMNKEINNRRSIRKYLNKQVPKEMIEQIIESGRMSPSAKNRQEGNGNWFRNSLDCEHLLFI